MPEPSVPVFLPGERLRAYIDDRYFVHTSPTLAADAIAMARELLWRRQVVRDITVTLNPDAARVPVERNAKLFATQHPQRLQEGCGHIMGRCRCDPPQHLRCDHVDDDFRRCVLGSGDHTDHKFREEG